MASILSSVRKEPDRYTSEHRTTGRLRAGSKYIASAARYLHAEDRGCCKSGSCCNLYRAQTCVRAKALFLSSMVAVPSVTQGHYCARTHSRRRLWYWWFVVVHESPRIVSITFEAGKLFFKSLLLDVLVHDHSSLRKR